jgi:urease accessory protein
MAAAELDFGVAGAGWRGALALEFKSAGERTFLAKRRHEGPFCVQQPFYPGDGACHTYLLHPPGGLAGGARLELDARVDGGAAALLTTPAATKFYRSDGAPSVVTQSLQAARGASLEWLPLETILFGGSRARIETRVELVRGARFIGWELTSLGRPLSRDAYATGSLEQRTRISLDGAPLLIERLAFTAGEALLDADYGLAGRNVWGALYAYPADTEGLAAARESLAATSDTSDTNARASASFTNASGATFCAPARCGATLLDELLVVRYLGTRPESARTALEALWAAVRAAVVGRVPCAPRIWRT